MASKRWEDDIAYAMTPIKLVTWPIGVWPLQVYNFYSLLRSIVSVFLSATVMFLPPIEIYMGCANAERTVDCLMLSFSGLLAVLKITFYRIYANNLINNYKSAVNDYMTIDNAKERDIMRKHVFLSRIASFPLLFCSYYSCIAYTLVPFMNHGEINQNVTDENIMLEYPVPSKCAMKYFHVPISMHKIFVIIQGIALVAVTNANKGLIRKIIDVINYTLLLELLITSICLCTMGFQFLIAMKEKDTAKMGQSLMIQIVYLVSLTGYSFIGRYIKSQMEDIGYSIYQIAWYEFPMKLMRNLVFIFMQAEGPAMLQAGNFVVYINCNDVQYKEKNGLRIMHFHFGQFKTIIFN
ncbi:uncharacterized protein LOC105251728 isoform X4 [Camponotus floridanus]|uniref:uncharacterized protein LOC105251728 isoform X4 n=1 Tax=Camponotus floridanus TaxID=104421 RepID=UPI000DC69D48|nr:uncharacterized protein LOC105251728 isoform X4 [Camponotus floridanus]